MSEIERQVAAHQLLEMPDGPFEDFPQLVLRGDIRPVWLRDPESRPPAVRALRFFDWYVEPRQPRA